MNTGVYPEEWATALQERLNKPTNWKEACQVIYSNTKIFNFPYMATEFSTQTGTRGSSYSFSDFTLTNDTVDIATIELEPVFIDRADLAQCTLNTVVDIATRQGDHMSEEIEAGWLADHGSWTNFDAGTLATGTASTVAITVSANNIDDIIRKVKTKIGEANGQSLADRDGIFIVWRYKDLEELEKFAQANGFTLADKALKNGIKTGYHFMGVDHYVSNSHTDNHLCGGVKKVCQIGILKSTWGKVTQTVDPNMQSGVGVVSRADYGLNVKAAHGAIVFDIICNA